MKKVADKEELLKVFDENRKYLGYMEKRSIVHEQKLFHNEVALWVIDNEKHMVLLQRRSPNKKYWPNKLGLCAGHVVENETFKDAIKKEAFEELGINLDNYNVKRLLTIKRTEPNNYCFSHHFYIFGKINLNKIMIQKEELSEVLYMDYYVFKDMVKNNSDEVMFYWNDEYQRLFNKLDKIV